MDMLEMLDPSDDLLRINGLFDHCHFFKSNGFPAKSITVWFNFTSWHLCSIMFWWQTELVWNIKYNAKHILNSKKRVLNLLVFGWLSTFTVILECLLFYLLFPLVYHKWHFHPAPRFRLRQNDDSETNFPFVSYWTCLSSSWEHNFFTQQQNAFLVLFITQWKWKFW